MATGVSKIQFRKTLSQNFAHGGNIMPNKFDLNVLKNINEGEEPNLAIFAVRQTGMEIESELDFGFIHSKGLEESVAILLDGIPADESYKQLNLIVDNEYGDSNELEFDSYNDLEDCVRKTMAEIQNLEMV